MRKAFAFIKRDFRIHLSYRLDFALDFLSIFATVVTFYFIAKLFGKSAIPYLKDYGGDYFSFVLIGIAFFAYLRVALGSFAGSISEEQMQGTLEAMLATPTKISTIIISSSLWSFIFSSVDVLIYLLLGAVLFGVSFKLYNLFPAAIILLLTMTSFSSLGIISASFIMVFKRGDPLSWFIAGLFGLLGGVYYPITILPEVLQKISYFLPITYTLRSLRHALLQGYSMGALMPDIFALLIFSAVLLPLSILIFKFAVKKARIDGSLVHY